MISQEWYCWVLIPCVQFWKSSLTISVVIYRMPVTIKPRIYDCTIMGQKYYNLESGQTGALIEYNFIRIDYYIKSYLKVV